MVSGSARARGPSTLLTSWPESLCLVADRHSFPEAEEETLKWWQENNTFEESVKRSEGSKPFVFYDGPPFATGLPHYGHILAGTLTDIVCRYAHHTGHYAERRFDVVGIDRLVARVGVVPLLGNGRRHPEG